MLFKGMTQIWIALHILGFPQIIFTFGYIQSYISSNWCDHSKYDIQIDYSILYIIRYSFYK